MWKEQGKTSSTMIRILMVHRYAQNVIKVENTMDITNRLKILKTIKLRL